MMVRRQRQHWVTPLLLGGFIFFCVSSWRIFTHDSLKMDENNNMMMLTKQAGVSSTASRMQAAISVNESSAGAGAAVRNDSSTEASAVVLSYDATSAPLIDDGGAKRLDATVEPTKSIAENSEALPILPSIPPYLRNNESLPEYLHATKRLFSHARTDRSGAAMLNAFLAHAYAYHYGIPFEGICGKTNFGKDHENVIETFGLSHVLKWQSCPQKGQDHVDTYVDRSVAGGRGANTAMLTPEWLQVIRSLRNISSTPTSKRSADTLWEQNNNNNNSNNTTALKVAVHVRRGDISPCRNFRRYLRNQFYLDLLDEVLGTNGTNATTTKDSSTDITIYTEDDSYESMQDFIDRGYRVICGGDLNHVWAAMDTQYDMLIMSLSTFSYIPAILSLNLDRIIYIPTTDWTPLQSWEVAPMKLVKEAEAWVNRERKSERCLKIKEGHRVWYNCTLRVEDSKRWSKDRGQQKMKQA